MRRLSLLLSIGLVLSLGLSAFAQEPIYKITINVVERTTKAINYVHRGGSTTIDFKGTPLLPNANGESKVESKQGYIEIEVEFDDLQSATRFGPEYLTYVMWAITPEGRATNLGEVILNGTKSKLNVTTELQAFGLIVTAEPYFAVTQPSDVVVMENAIRPETRGKIEEVEAKYELLKRGQYTVNVPPAELKPIPLDRNVPLDLFQARNAVRIARWAGANQDAADTFQKADTQLLQAEKHLATKQNSRTISQVAREAVQTAEDARLIALKRQEENRLTAERQQSADREAQARAAADRARTNADRERANAEQARVAAERARADAERAAADASAQAQRRALAEQEQRFEAERRARAEAERQAADAQRLATEAQARAAADAAARAADASARERDAIRAEADRARQAAERAEQEKVQLRAMLIQQLNRILETRDSARGLIVNMSDVLFDTGKYTLKPGAREKLSRVAGIILAHPGLLLQVEGHTDSVGSDDLNQKLSEQRAMGVRDYLVQQGINSAGISSRGMGEGYPVASNDTAAGRQQNRRVEMIVAGDVIGVPLRISVTLP